MLLSYTRRGRSVRISRAPVAGEQKRVLIATIDLRRTKVRIVDGVVASAEEVKEIEEAAKELASTDPEKRQATFGYADATAGAMKYYFEKATELDKHLIGDSVRGAFRTLRKAQPPQSKPKQKKAVDPVSPDMVAVALYRAFAENSKGKVNGEPGAARQTEIRGVWDLHEVARKILSQA